MQTKTIEKWVWILIYGGLLLVGLGLAVQRSDESLGLGMVVVGGLIAFVGVVLIVVRSRMKAGGDS